MREYDVTVCLTFGSLYKVERKEMATVRLRAISSQDAWYKACDHFEGRFPHIAAIGLFKTKLVEVY